MTTCLEAGCDRPPNGSRGRCWKHYQQLRRRGGLPERPNQSERFWALVDRAGPPPATASHLGACWLWRASAGSQGYGKFFLSRLQGWIQAHRYAYQLLVGPIPEGLHLDHLCRVRRCVRPSHLEPVTAAENMRRAMLVAERLPHCRRGHPYDEANTYYQGHQRNCRECRRHRSRKARAQRTQQANTGG